MSSVDDLLYWDRNFYDDRLGNGTVVKEIQARGAFNNGKQNDYAMGLIVAKYRGLPVVDHSGALFGYATDILRFPQQHFTVISLCNLASADPEALTRRVADVYLGNQLSSVPHSPESAVTTIPNALDPMPYAGTYETTSHLILPLFIKDGQLIAAPFPGSLRPVSHGHFVSDNIDLLFDDRGPQMRVVMTQIDGTTDFATRIHPPQITAADLAEYAGTYMSPELETEYKLSVERGRLVLHQGLRPAVPLSLIAQDEFNDGNLITLVFKRGSGGKLAGFEVFTLRAGGVAFTRK
jgi:hypothetical protein